MTPVWLAGSGKAQEQPSIVKDSCIHAVGIVLIKEQLSVFDRGLQSQSQQLGSTEMQFVYWNMHGEIT